MEVNKDQTRDTDTDINHQTHTHRDISVLENNSRLNQMADKFMAEGGVCQNRIVDCMADYITVDRRLHRRSVLRDYNRLSSSYSRRLTSDSTSEIAPFLCRKNRVEYSPPALKTLQKKTEKGKK